MGKTSQIAAHHDQVMLWTSQGVERPVIAQMLGVSPCAVQAYLQRRKIEPVKMLGKALLPQRSSETRILVPSFN